MTAIILSLALCMLCACGRKPEQPTEGQTPEESPAGTSAEASETASEEASETASEETSSETPAETPAESSSAASEPFRYEHDPRENPTAMADIVEDPKAVYGFAPSPEGGLKSYCSFDWSDPAVVEGGRQERIEYHKSIEGMYTMLHQMRDEGKSIEEMARAISAERNRLRLESYKDNPEGLKAAKESNLAKYGNEEGPTADYLFGNYGSWEVVLQKAFSTNPGMDALLGLYDDYYTLYVELGMIPGVQ